MFKRKKSKEQTSVNDSVSELGLEFSSSSSEEEDEDEEGGGGVDYEPPVPRESVVEQPALWSGNFAFCGALPLSTWGPDGAPQRKGPLTEKYARSIHPTLMSRHDLPSP